MLSDRLRLQDVRNTSTFRLTALFGLVFVVCMAALLGLIYGLSARELIGRSDHILRTEAHVLRAVPSPFLPQRIAAEIASNPSNLTYFELKRADGRPMAGNILVSRLLPAGRAIDMLIGDRPIRVLEVPLPCAQTLLIGRDISPIVDLRHRVFDILLWSGLATVLCVLVSGLVLSIEPLRRLRDLQRASRVIAAGNLEARMPLEGRGDELDLIAGTVNTMVEEVGRVVAQVKGVTDAVAHDLRTPLTRVRSQLYRARQSPRLEGRVAAMIEAATLDLDVVLDRFAILLRISELEVRGRHAGFGPIELDALAREVRDLYEPLAEERAVTLTLAPAEPVRVIGDGKLLLEAVSHLVDNAIKFVASDGHVTLSVLPGEHGPVIEVRDDGPGISPGTRHEVLHRFRRSAHVADVPGRGLGLSVVAAIVHLHGFQLEFDDAEPGLVVRILCEDNEGALAARSLVEAA